MNLVSRRHSLLTNSKPPLKFYVIYKGTTYEYNFDDGMTWAEFVASDYNDGNFTLSGTAIYYNSDGMLSNISSTTVIIEEATYNTRYYIFKEGTGLLTTVYSKSSYVNTDRIDYITYDLYRANYLNIQQSFTGYNTLCFEGKSATYTNDSGTTSYNSAFVGYGSTALTKAAKPATSTQLLAQKTRGTVSFDISALSGNYYVQIGETIYTKQGSYKDYIYNIWLE